MPTLFDDFNAIEQDHKRWRANVDAGIEEFSSKRCKETYRAYKQWLDRWVKSDDVSPLSAAAAKKAIRMTRVDVDAEIAREFEKIKFKDQLTIEGVLNVAPTGEAGLGAGEHEQQRDVHVE